MVVTAVLTHAHPHHCQPCQPLTPPIINGTTSLSSTPARTGPYLPAALLLPQPRTLACALLAPSQPLTIASHASH